jgi:hypothetical protein
LIVPGSRAIRKLSPLWRKPVEECHQNQSSFSKVKMIQEELDFSRGKDIGSDPSLGALANELDGIPIKQLTRSFAPHRVHSFPIAE